MTNWDEPTPDPGSFGEDVAVFALLGVLVLVFGIIVGSLFSPEFNAWVHAIRLPMGW